jgi:hypothetical protein
MLTAMKAKATGRPMSSRPVSAPSIKQQDGWPVHRSQLDVVALGGDAAPKRSRNSTIMSAIARA